MTGIQLYRATIQIKRSLTPSYCLELKSSVTLDRLRNSVSISEMLQNIYRNFCLLYKIDNFPGQQSPIKVNHPVRPAMVQ